MLAAELADGVRRERHEAVVLVDRDRPRIAVDRGRRRCRRHGPTRDSRAARSTLSVPPMFVSKSSRGFSCRGDDVARGHVEDQRRSPAPARARAPRPLPSPARTGRCVGMVSARPVKRSSRTVTRAPDSTSRRTSAPPTKPAPPVTRTRRPPNARSAGRSSLDPRSKQDCRPEETPPVAQPAHLRVALLGVVADGDRHLDHSCSRAGWPCTGDTARGRSSSSQAWCEVDLRIVEDVERNTRKPFVASVTRRNASSAERHRIQARPVGASGADRARSSARLASSAIP